MSIQNNLVVELEEEKHRIKCELEKHNKEHSISLFTGAASLSIGKIMSQLSQYEADSISKINKADIKSEYAQTEICDINNILISQRPSDINNSKPRIYCNFTNFRKIINIFKQMHEQLTLIIQILIS